MADTDTQTVAPPQYTPSADETGALEALKTGPMKSVADPFERLYKQSQQASFENETAKRKQAETLAKGKSDAVQTMYAGMQEQKTAMDKMAPPPKMNITPDTHEGLMGLATILPIAGILLGSKGMMSGVNAMNAMTGVMKGYQEGNQARIEFEKQKYDTSMKEWDANYKISRQKLADAIEMMKTNYQAGVAKAETAAVAMGPEPAAIVRQNGAAFLLSKLDEANKHVLAAQEKLSQVAPTPVIDTQTGKSTFATRAQISENPERYQPIPKSAGAMSKIGQSVSGIVDQMMPEAQDAAKRSITQYGLSAADQKLIPANWASIKEADDISRYIDQHPNAVGPLAQIAGKTGEFGQSLVANIKNAFGINPQAGVQAASAASADVDRKLDEYAAANPGKADDVQAAKVLSKRLFSLALQDAIAVGRPTVFLEKSLSSFYSPTVRPDTLKELIKTRAEEAENRLPPIFQTKNSKTPFSILIGERIGTAPLTYKSTADVAEAYRQGKISREDASKILKDQFGVQQ